MVDLKMTKESSLFPRPSVWRLTSKYCGDPLSQTKTWFELFGPTYRLKLEGQRYLVSHDQEILGLLSQEDQTDLKPLERIKQKSSSPPAEEAHEWLNTVLMTDWLKPIQSFTALEVARQLERGRHQPFTLSHSVDQLCRCALTQLLWSVDLRQVQSPAVRTLEDAQHLLSRCLLTPLPRAIKIKRRPRARLKRVMMRLDQQLTPAPWLMSSADPLGQLERLLSFCIHWTHDLSALIQWFWVYLSQRPDLIEKLQIEIAQTLSDQAYTPSALKELPTLLTSLLEVMRLSPPRWNISFNAPPLEALIDTPLHPKTKLLIFPYWLHRDPAHWSAPERFDPQRFLPFIDRDTPLPSSFRPFGLSESYSEGMSSTLTWYLHFLAAHLTTILRRGSIQVYGTPLDSIYPYRALFPSPLLQSTFVPHDRFVHIPSERI
jgi:hypothetical protein